MNQDNRSKGERVRIAIDDAWQRLDQFRQRRHEYAKEYSGFNYSDNAAVGRRPHNLIFQLVQTYGYHLSAGTPRAQVHTDVAHLKPLAADVEAVVNDIVKRTGFRRTHRRFVQSAMFTIGVIKVGIASSGRDKQSTVEDTGQVFIRDVDFDDLILDLRAKRWEEMEFIGDRYRVPFASLQDPGYDQEVVKKLQPYREQMSNIAGSPRIETIASDRAGVDAWVDDEIELIDVWLPSTREIYTYAVQGTGVFQSEPIRVTKWDGPENYLGPYHCLWFDEGEGNAMPVSPVSQVYDLHISINDNFSKLIEQSLRQKNIGVASTAHDDDARRIIHARDGDVVRGRLTGPGVQEFKFGGPDAMNMNFLLQQIDLADRNSGNLSLLSGQAPQSETLGQDQMLADAANRRLRDMQDRVLDCLKGILRDVAWWVLTDPMLDERTTREVAGAEIPVRLTAEQIDDNPDAFLDFNFDIDPYSLSGQSPSQKLAGLLNIVSQVAMPMMQFLESQGMSIDGRYLMEQIAQLSGNDSLHGLIIDSQTGDNIGAGSQRQRSRQAAATTRTQIRRNVSGDKTGEMQQRQRAEIQSMAAAAERDNRS